VLSRANAILDAFDGEHLSLTLTGLVARTGLPKTTVFRICEEMIHLGWIEHRGGRYRVGTRLFERASLAGPRASVRDAALPFLQELCAATRETTHLAVIDGVQIVYLEKLVGRGPVTKLSRVGGRMPALCTGLGKVLTAFSDQHVREEVIGAGVVARTPHTLTKPWKIRRELARIRDEGMGYDHEESGLGLRCVAAPVAGPDGSCVAAVSLTGPVERLNVYRAAPIVRRAARQASLALKVMSADESARPAPPEGRLIMPGRSQPGQRRTIAV
jgi:DNA-binding IclR family transcriptional regulator